MFGMNKEQTIRAAGVLRILGEEWRDPVAGREGFLVQKNRAGLLRQGVVWGEMDCMVFLPFRVLRFLLLEFMCGRDRARIENADGYTIGPCEQCNVYKIC